MVGRSGKALPAVGSALRRTGLFLLLLLAAGSAPAADTWELQRELPFRYWLLACTVQADTQAQVDCGWRKEAPRTYSGACLATVTQGGASRAYRATARITPTAMIRLPTAPDFSYGFAGINCSLKVPRFVRYVCDVRGDGLTCRICLFRQTGCVEAVGSIRPD